MLKKISMTLAALALLAISGCRGSAPVDHRAGSDDLADRSIGRGSILTAEQLQFEYGSILDAMSRKFTSFRVDRRFACPAISLRGRPNTVPGVTEPVIYVNGTPAIDTCILNILNATDVARVEIYPRGFTSRPGYANSPYGLILVFMRDR